MIGQLILKEFQTNSLFKTHGIKRVISIISSIVLLAFFICLEILIYSLIYNKINVYADLNDSFFIVLIFAITILGILGYVPITQKTFFNSESERLIYSTLPLTSYDIILSKGVNLYTKLLIFNLSTSYVFGATYAYIRSSNFTFYIIFFFMMLLLTFLMEGVAFLLVIPFNEFKKLLSKYKILSFIIMIALLLFLVISYSLILNAFINLVRDASLDNLFTASNIEFLNYIAKYLLPISSMTYFSRTLDMSVNFLGSFLIPLFIFSIGTIILNLYIKKYFNSSLAQFNNKKVKSLTYKFTNETNALIRKEIHLALNKNDGIFSYISLIIAEPFLVFSVVSSVNLIFNTGNLNYVLTLFPSIYLTLDTLLILLFLSIINLNSSMSIAKEKNTLLIMKTLPVSYFKQFLIKLSVPSILSFISYLIGLILLVSFKEISVINFFMMILIGASSIISLNISSLYTDLRGKKENNFLVTFIGFIFPIITVGVGTVTIVFIDNEFSELIFFSIILLIQILYMVSLLINIKKRISKLFLRFEGVNL